MNIWLQTSASMQPRTDPVMHQMSARPSAFCMAGSEELSRHPRTRGGAAPPPQEPAADHADVIGSRRSEWSESLCSDSAASRLAPASSQLDSLLPRRRCSSLPVARPFLSFFFFGPRDRGALIRTRETGVHDARREDFWSFVSFLHSLDLRQHVRSSLEKRHAHLR